MLSIVRGCNCWGGPDDPDHTGHCIQCAGVWDLESWEFPLIRQRAGDNLCGQCCVAMLLRVDIDDACRLVGHKHRTTIMDLHTALADAPLWIAEPWYSLGRLELPPSDAICLLRARFDKALHWALWVSNRVVCPALGVKTFEQYVRDYGARVPSYWRIER